MQCSDLLSVNSDISIDYTYHRHSAPKDVIYYRCSDKRCKARLHYNQRTGRTTLKNQHLASSLHKPARLPKSLSEPKLQREYEETEKLKCHEALPAPQSSRNVTLLNAFPGEFANIQLRVESLEQARRICEEAVGQSLASQACYMEKGRIYSLSNAQVTTEDSGVCVSLEVNKQNVRKVTEMMTKALGKRPKMDFFCVLQADISVT
jgi:hypothetical protein